MKEFIKLLAGNGENVVAEGSRGQGFFDIWAIIPKKRVTQRKVYEEESSGMQRLTHMARV